MRKSFLARKQNTPRFRRLRSEPLEARQMLSITVDTLVDEADGSIDDGDVSLRDAIALAPIGETIDFSVNGTILLTLGELVIDKDLTIDGPGAELLTIDASGNDPTPNSTLDDGDDTNDGDGSRVFNVDDGNNEHNVDVTISAVTVTGGDSPNPGGGVVSVENLTTVDASVRSNHAHGQYNSAGNGGGIASYGNLVLIRTLVTENMGWDGGGIRADDSADPLDPSVELSILIVESSITNNLAMHHGGGLSVSNGDRNDNSNIPLPVTISGSTVADNSAGETGRGGGLDFFGELDVSVHESLITGNRKGGIAISYVEPGFSLTNSLVTGNLGGGVSGRSTTVTIASSTISDNNTTGSGGGIVLVFGTLSIEDSTISANAGIDAGGIWIIGTLATISRSTITNNTAIVGSFPGRVGGGLGNYGGADPIPVDHSIIANNRLDDGTSSDVNAPLEVTSAYNLVGVDTGLTGITNGVNGNIIGTEAMPIDPTLGPLQDNGGPTPTYAPLAGSPVIDAGDPAFVPPPLTDQRGYYRVVDGDGDMTATIDIGAVEYGSVPPLPGDGNLDQMVDGRDYLLWADNYGSDPADDPLGTPLNGDYNGDGVVDGLDYLLWAANYGASLATATVAAQPSALVDVALVAESEATNGAAAGGSLRYGEHAPEHTVTLAVDAVFEGIALKKNPRHRRR